MGKIILIEDGGSLSRDLSNELSKSHEVITAYSYASAKGLWGKHKGQFDCIILDLNINPNGLEEKSFKFNCYDHLKLVPKTKTSILKLIGCIETIINAS